MGIAEYFGVLIVLIISFFFMLAPYSIALIIYYIIKRKQNKYFLKNQNIDYKKNKYKEVDVERIPKQYDISKLKTDLYDLFYKFEIAYNNLDCNTLYNISTPRLYSIYYEAIRLGTKLGEKRIITNIKNDDFVIFDYIGKKENDEKKETFKAYVELSYVNYTQNTKGVIISGSTKEIKEKFEVYFVKIKSLNKYKCPYCGAINEGNVCDYCKSKITDKNEFRIDEIRKIEAK